MIYWRMSTVYIKKRKIFSNNIEFFSIYLHIYTY